MKIENMYQEIKFGTDGWRAIIAREFTFDNVRACAQGVAQYVAAHNQKERGVLIGYDTRFASEDFAAASAEVLAANGVKVYLCPQAAPTPVVSFGVRSLEAAAGIIITASHNGHQWNGFKIKNEEGASAPVEIIEEVESHIHSLKDVPPKLALEEGIKKGIIEYHDPRSLYIKAVAKLADLSFLRKARLKIAVDSMYGAGSGYFKELLSSTNIKIEEIKGERNPFFPGIHPEPIAKNLKDLCKLAPQSKADVGLATDGDADRIGIIDEKGNFLTQLQVYALLVYYFLEVKGERGPVVTTITCSSMIPLLGEKYQVPVFETPVGFKYVAPVMQKEKAIIGGEESGGYAFKGHVPERDGILAGLYFLDFLVKTGKKPSELLAELYSKVGPHYYDRLDLEFEAEKRGEIIKRIEESQVKSLAGEKIQTWDRLDGFRFILESGDWTLVRFSGTEPLIRIYAEAGSMARVRKLLEEMRGIMGV